jgi:ribonuclease P/MRP protein subunit RPP1
MFEAVHVAPEGESTLARIAATAADYGYEGLVVRNHGDRPAQPSPEALLDRSAIDLVDGIEISAEDPSRASGFLGSHRPDTTIVLVHGGDPAINAFAVRQEAVDVLAHPMAADGDLNHVLVRQAADHDVRLEFDLSPVLRSVGNDRSHAIRKLLKLAELVEKYDVPYVVSGDPMSHLQLRAPRELRSVADAIGLDPEIVETGLAEWAKLATRNRDRRHDSFVAPGVRKRPGEEP